MDCWSATKGRRGCCYRASPPNMGGTGNDFLARPAGRPACDQINGNGAQPLNLLPLSFFGRRVAQRSLRSFTAEDKQDVPSSQRGVARPPLELFQFDAVSEDDVLIA